MRCKILASASVTPPVVAGNDRIAAEQQLPLDAIALSAEIDARRYIESGTPGTAILAEATRRALGEIGKTPDDIEMIVASTVTPDHQFPGNAAFLQKELGIKGQAIFDIRACDGGFLHTLASAADFVTHGGFKTVLLAANDIFSTFLWHSPEGAGTDELFGDGAAVCVLAPSETDAGIVSLVVGNDPANVRSFWAEKPSTIDRPRLTRELIERGEWHFHLDLDAMQRQTADKLPRVAAQALEQAGVTAADIKLFIPGTLKMSWGQDAARVLGIPAERTAEPQRDRGYYGTAMIPTVLHTAWHNGAIRRGDLVLAAAVGAGISYGAMVYRV
ncbi:hypothetical protein K8I61_11970 [bacterium]|nr:hypothetical protein [bacterium]